MSFPNWEHLNENSNTMMMIKKLFKDKNMTFWNGNNSLNINITDTGMKSFVDKVLFTIKYTTDPASKNWFETLKK